MFDNMTILVIVALGAVLASVTALRYPLVSLGVLFVMASFSRDTLQTPLGTMRPEMPAVAAVAVILLVGRRFGSLRHPTRPTLAVFLSFATYLLALAISSMFVAPDRSQSVHMVAWLAMSMLAGIEAFVLIQPRPIDAVRPLAFGGFVIGATGILIAIVFLVAGPTVSFGVQDAYAALPRVYGLAWEANLYASFLAICAFFALETARGHRATASLIVLAAVLVGFPLGVTRAAYVGLLAGAVTYAGVCLFLKRPSRDLLRLGAIGTAFLVVGIGASVVLLPNVVTRGYVPPPVVGPSASPTGSSGSAGAPGPVSPFGPSVDTMGYRLERVPIALKELPGSPLVGFGAMSFGQENPGRYNGSGPDYIAVMSIAVLYESGVVGAIGLALGFVLLLALLWISARRFAAERNSKGAGAAAAFSAAIICMLVAYQATNALPYAVSWIMIGAAAAVAASNTSGLTLRDLLRPSQYQPGQNTKLET